jgi:hypothetical protein
MPLPSIAVREGRLPGDGAGSMTLVTIPRLSPHLAKVSLEWPTICKERGVLSEDVFNYAMAWCQYTRDRKVDLEHALIVFMSSSEPGLPAAAVADLIDVVAEAHDAATSMSILDRAKAPPGSLEKLAAIYASLGREDDERVIRSRLPAPPPPQTGCSELDAALETFVPQSVTTIRNVAAGTSNCAALARSLVCRIQAVSEALPRDQMCAATSVDVPQNESAVREAHYLAAYAHWNTDWFAAVEHATRAMPEPGAEQVAVAALSASLRTNCEPERLREVNERAELLLRDPAHDAHWTATLKSLATITPKTCRGLQAAPRFTRRRRGLAPA